MPERMSRQEFGEKKRERLDDVRRFAQEATGSEKLPKEAIRELVDIRQEIRTEVAEVGYVEQISPLQRERIRALAERLSTSAPERSTEVTRLLEEYFHTYRLAQNAESFRKEVQTTIDDIAGESERRITNFYKQDARGRLLEERVTKRFAKAGFSEQEIKDLLATCDVAGLDQIEVHHLSTLAKMREAFDRFMKGDKTEYVGLSMALMVPAVLEGFAPSLLAKAFSGDRVQAGQVGLYALTTLAAAGASGALRQRLTDFFGKTFAKEGGMNAAIAENLAEIPAERLQEVGKEEVELTVRRGSSGYERAFELASNDVIPSVVTLTTSAAVLAAESPILAASTLGGGLLAMRVNTALRERMHWWEKRAAAQVKEKQASKMMEEQLNAHLEIVLSGMKDDLRERFAKLQKEQREATAAKEMIDVWQEKMGSVFRVANMVAAASASLLSGGSPDRFVAALVYTGQLQESISKMLHAKERILDALIDVQEMEFLFNGHAEEEQGRETERIGVSQVRGGDIALKGVTVRMGKTEILNIPDLRIPQGSFVSLHGASGAGKTTLMKLLSGYYQPTTGEVHWGDTDIRNIARKGDDALYNAICYLPQFPYLREGSIRDNVRFGVKQNVDDAEIRQILQEVGLAKRFRNLDEEIRPGRGDVGTTSGGETSRLGLARALLKLRTGNARVVFFDEPTASVDKYTRDEIARIIRSEKERRPDVTFVVISHDEAFVQQLNCTMDVEMRNGKILQKP